MIMTNNKTLDLLCLPLELGKRFMKLPSMNPTPARNSTYLLSASDDSYLREERPFSSVRHEASEAKHEFVTRIVRILQINRQTRYEVASMLRSYPSNTLSQIELTILIQDDRRGAGPRLLG